MIPKTPPYLLLFAYLLVGLLYASQTPAWQAPDEPAHYNYIRQLAGGKLPVIEPGDYNQTYQSEAISAKFAPAYSIDPFEYEDHQPPLYYLLQTPIFLLSGGSLLALRLVSLLLGAGVVWLAYCIGRRLFPESPWLGLTAAAFVAFLPQHVAMLSAVNNDSLAELLIAGILLLLITAVQEQWAATDRRWLLLGLLLGLGFLSKATTYIMAPLIGLLLLRKNVVILILNGGITEKSLSLSVLL